MSPSPASSPSLAVPRPGRRVQRAFSLLKGAVLGAILATAVTANVQAAPSQVQRVIDPEAALLSQLMHDNRCSTTGFADQIPASALIRTPSGRLQMVSFARGWEAHTGNAPGELVAVCLGGRGVERS